MKDLILILSILPSLCQCTTKTQNHTVVPFYTLEEHWTAPALASLAAANPIPTLLGVASRGPLLIEVGPNRIASMDANNIQIQIVSHVPAPEGMFLPNLTALANDQLAERIALNPTRFRGFCILPMGKPSEAAAELRRCVKTHGFVGALVDCQLSTGIFYDSPDYDQLWATAVELEVPIYLHPAWPNLTDIVVPGVGLYAPAVAGEYTDHEATVLATTAWGWHGKAGISFIKLYLAGVFDRFPDLQIILGHMGELLPYFLTRADNWISGNRTLRFKDAWASNVYVTTSGMFSLDPMATLLRTTDKKRILYSVDWPFETNENGTAFMEALRDSGMVTEREFEDIAFGNFKRLAKIRV